MLADNTQQQTEQEANRRQGAEKTATNNAKEAAHADEQLRPK